MNAAPELAHVVGDPEAVRHGADPVLQELAVAPEYVNISFSFVSNDGLKPSFLRETSSDFKCLQCS